MHFWRQLVARVFVLTFLHCPKKNLTTQLEFFRRKNPIPIGKFQHRFNDHSSVPGPVNDGSSRIRFGVTITLSVLYPRRTTIEQLVCREHDMRRSEQAQEGEVEVKSRPYDLIWSALMSSFFHFHTPKSADSLFPCLWSCLGILGGKQNMCGERGGPPKHHYFCVHFSGYKRNIRTWRIKS